MVIIAAVSGTREVDPVVETAYDLAETYDEDLHVLHVIPDEEFQERQSGGGSDDNPSYYLDNAITDAEELAADVVEATLGDYDEARVTPTGEVGDPTEMVLALADDHDARFIVIGGRKRTPVGKALFGSTTQSLLLHADRPVVTVMRGE
ncbi:universal stress protein [Halovivax limisalsi]|uniref:universal stress protein n=1 Tax=Halovivax limisalsi TaxID=1453760 RepID=UPI001FFCFFFA|nr:universal stress protein [Halovivax limisalsi]